MVEGFGLEESEVDEFVGRGASGWVEWYEGACVVGVSC